MPGPPSIAQSLFDRIENPSGGQTAFEYLRRLADPDQPPTFEGQYLEVKVGTTPNGDRRPEDFDAAFCEALAGFATTGGGVLILGLATGMDKRNKSGRIDGVAMVRNPEEVRNRLERNHHQATDPPVLGVDFKFYADPADETRGFVVIHVPESRFKPHRSEAPGKKRWVMRVNDKFVDVPPPVLRSLFYPQRHARLVVQCSPILRRHAEEPDGIIRRVDFRFRVKNLGPSTAHDLTLKFSLNPELEYHASVGWQARRVEPYHRFSQTGPIHPGDALHVCVAETIEKPIPNSISRYRVHEMDFEVQVFATDQEPTSCAVTLDQNQIMAGDLYTFTLEPLDIDKIF